MTEEEFRKILEKYDWFYSMSSDPRVWKAGLEETIRIQNICSENEELKKIYEEERLKFFK